MAEDAIARVRRLHEAALRNTYSLHGTQMQEFVEKMLRLAPALCDVIDAARQVREGFNGPTGLSQLRDALDALDRAAEEEDSP